MGGLDSYSVHKNFVILEHRLVLALVWRSAELWVPARAA